MRGFARVGIEALVDEATGYQRIREERALSKILERYIADELQPWTKTFPYNFYEGIVKLKQWPSIYAIKRPFHHWEVYQQQSSMSASRTVCTKSFDEKTQSSHLGIGSINIISGSHLSMVIPS